MLRHPTAVLSAPPSSTPQAIRPLTLHLRPLAEAVRYEAVACWEAYTNGDYQTSTITKRLTLGLRPEVDGGVELDFQTDPPALRKPADLESLETLALRLAALYQRVVLRAAPTGQFLAVTNHADLLATWQALAQGLRESTTAEDQITPTLIDFMSRQLQDPANVLRSLQHDYLYRTLVHDLYDQPLGAIAGAGRTRWFSQFFDKLPLCFSERVEVLPAAADGAPTLVLHGTLDAQETDVAAIGKLMATAVGPPPGLAAAPHFHYQATYVLDPRTDMPLTVEVTVYGRLADLYNKQYTLTISRV